MKKTILFISTILVLCTGVIVAAEVLVPPSIQIYFAGVAGCDINEAEISKKDPDFDGVNFWEPPLSQYYRLREWYLGGNKTISDEIAGTISPYHALLAAYDQHGHECGENIEALFKRYIDQGIPVNQISSIGYSPLHEAIIARDIPLIELLVNADADLNLKVTSDNQNIKGMNAIELTKHMAKSGDTEFKKILDILYSTDSR